MSDREIFVVGGGPAGMMAAVQASQQEAGVTLIEKNSNLGKKLLLTGNGRCNITNLCDQDSFFKRFSKNGEFLRDAFKVFFNQELIEFFKVRGVEFKTEEDMKVFPKNGGSESIFDVLRKELEKSQVKIIHNCRLEDIIVKDSRVEGVKLKERDSVLCDAVILATGGVSYGSSGSTGDGLKIAERLGHSMVELMPGLVPLEVEEDYPKFLEGLTLKNIRLVFSDGKKRIVSQIGDLLFTGFGISGPLVLTLSGKVVDLLKEGQGVYVDMDLEPSLSREEIEESILDEIRSGPKRTIKNMLEAFLPERLIEVFLEISDIHPDKLAVYITQKERKQLVGLFKGMRLSISGSRPIDVAMVTRGGISLKDVDPRTMESRIVKGLYFAGEILDLDADSGGFNLQAAFSTGYLAGQSAAEI
ncbi:NAD(P)/FAD-dependent oxidoreductase [Thermoproteota archaeon]